MYVHHIGWRSLSAARPGLIQDFHRNGVKVLFPYNPWDTGTHDPGAAWSEVLPQTMAEIEADGLNGDTLATVDNAFYQSSLTDKRPLALEPELGCGTGIYFDGIGTAPQGLVSVPAAVQWNTMGWGYWQPPYTSLGVSLPKWFEPRFTVHVNDRWSMSKIAMLQAAFFNGTGLESWENIWGTWNRLSAPSVCSIWSEMYGNGLILTATNTPARLLSEVDLNISHRPH